MKRKIVEIDQAKCNGCGLCVSACHEGAIGIVNGKAQLLKDDWCDGLGDCLPACPKGAISFTEREAAAYNEAAAAAAKTAAGARAQTHAPAPAENNVSQPTAPASGSPDAPSELSQWPTQIKLVPTNAPYFKDADLLIASDCTAFAYAGFHSHFMRGRITLIGCPKLDAIDYAEKLALIIANNSIRSIIVARMEVPCCGGLENAARRALQASGKSIPLRVETISVKGELLA